MSVLKHKIQIKRKTTSNDTPMPNLAYGELVANDQVLNFLVKMVS